MRRGIVSESVSRSWGGGWSREIAVRENGAWDAMSGKILRNLLLLVTLWGDREGFDTGLGGGQLIDRVWRVCQREANTTYSKKGVLKLVRNAKIKGK
ncbi:hypothetical protein BBW65_05935 [Helicobacter enhydrae]|uniref:Uncharacterized protein n=1 Tax=Helicobacter enhydrae TaxID=222136 RepID=A0A1B1U6P8_9HELI|nr:hypothetical protein [Helicobacter enhydrae]ANV98365.1 hypothetical protein BBW65_05935 [Helicobacter enhydrae]